MVTPFPAVFSMVSVRFQSGTQPVLYRDVVYPAGESVVEFLHWHGRVPAAVVRVCVCCGYRETPLPDQRLKVKPAVPARFARG